jgi:hypothetical protein
MVGCQHGPTRNPSSAKLSTIAKQHVLIVTHATTEFDQNQTAAVGINQLVREFKSKGRPVVYLMSDQSEGGRARWYTTDRSPDFEVFSEGGEHNLPIAANEVTIVGGFFGSTDTLNGCHALAMKDAIRMHFEVSEAPLTIHIPLKATYFYDEWSAFRDTVLKTGRFDLSTIGIAKYPLASLFFLREGNDGAGDDGNEQLFAHSYSGRENKTYRRGEEVSREKYQFKFFLNDQLIESVSSSSGKRSVNFKMETLSDQGR